MGRRKKATMTVGSVIRVLQDLCESGQASENTVLEIVTEDESVGPTAAVGIECIYPGFDWNNNRLFISPASPLISKDKAEKQKKT